MPQQKMAVSVLTGPGTYLLLLLLGMHRYKDNLPYEGVHADVIISGLPKEQFKQLADVNIGVLLSLTNRGSGSEQFCKHELSSDSNIRYLEVNMSCLSADFSYSITMTFYALLYLSVLPFLPQVHMLSRLILICNPLCTSPSRSLCADDITDCSSHTDIL